MGELWTKLAEVIGVIGVGIFLLYAERLKSWLMDWFKQRKLNPIARAVLTCRAIVDYLVELRVKLNASRCYVMQFHNGQLFTSLDPIYRMSCTQEALSPGQATVQPEMQNILAQQVWQEIEPLFGEVTVAGCTRVFQEDQPDKPPYRGTYYYVTQQIPAGWFQSMLVGHGAWSAAISPLIDARGTLVGFIVVEFSDPKYKDGSSTPADLHRATHAAANIWFELERHING